MKSSSLQHIAKNFATLLRDSTPKELSKKSGISYSTLAPILRGERDFGVTKLVTLAEALNVTPNDILFRAYREPAYSKNNAVKASMPLFLVSFVTAAQMTRVCAYDLTKKERQLQLSSFSIDCTENASATIEALNSAIFKLCGKDIDLKKIYVYASAVGYEHLDGREKLKTMAAREYGLFLMEPDWKIAHSSIFPNKNGIMITINDGYVISFSTNHGQQVHKVQGYLPMTPDAGSIWLGCEAIKHAINVQEGFEPTTLLADKILGLVNSDLNLLATQVFDTPRKMYIKMSEIVRSLALNDQKSYSLIKCSFDNIWKRVRVIEKQVSEKPPICLAGELAYLYESFIPKERLIKLDAANEMASFDYSNNLLLKMIPK